MTYPNNQSGLLGSVSEQMVAIVGVDAAANLALGQTRWGNQVEIDLRYLVGTVHVVPSVGEQWFVKRLGSVWVLERKMAYGTDVLVNVADNPQEGLSQLGGSVGPTVVQGSQITVTGPLQFHSAETVDLPPASSMNPGSAMWDITKNKMVISDGQDWRDSGGSVVLGDRSSYPNGQGVLSATWMARPSSWPALTGNGVLTSYAVSGAGQAVSLTGQGRFTATYKVGNPAYPHGTGTLAAAVRMYRIARVGSLTGHGAFTATAFPFTPFNEENVQRTNQAVPLGCSGVYITLFGQGGTGGTGLIQSNVDRYGGGGGGGGAKVGRSFIARANLGTTYSLTVNTAANPGISKSGTGTITQQAGNDGAATMFASGGITLTANGGKGGGGGSSSSSSGGNGGTATQAGIAGMTLNNGTNGAAGTYQGTTTAAANNGNGAGAGGGGAGGATSGGSHNNAGKGGDSATKTGGSGGTTGSLPGGSATDAAAGNGGAGGGGSSSSGISGSGQVGNGGNGGKYGGGGGGSAGCATLNSSTPSFKSGDGGGGYALLEWI